MGVINGVPLVVGNYDENKLADARTIIRKLAEGEKLLGEGKSIDEVSRHLEITESTWHRWKNQWSSFIQCVESCRCQTWSSPMLMMACTTSGTSNDPLVVCGSRWGPSCPTHPAGMPPPVCGIFVA